MTLPLRPPVSPMLARLVRELPTGDDLLFEPKWDGFRALVFRDGPNVDVRSRNHKPLARYFPELVRAIEAVPIDRFVIDGEIVASAGGTLSFEALLQRLHPSRSRVERLATETPGSFVAFDALAIGSRDLRRSTLEARRSALTELLADVGSPLFLTPATVRAEVAMQWLGTSGAGLDGVVAKRRDLRYQAGKRAMLKVKLERTADCVVAGFRFHHDEPSVGSLLLGLHLDGRLVHVGLAAAFTRERRRQILHDVAPFACHLSGHPWEEGFGRPPGPVGRLPGVASRFSYGEEVTWVPLEPRLVCEVAYDHFDSGCFRYPPRFKRWRPDREPSSCSFDQFARSGPAPGITARSA